MELSVQAFDRICRVCLTESSTMKSLFTKLESGQELLDLLIFTANIDVNSVDELPQQVCVDCEALIHKADMFKRRCINSETILKNLYKSSSIQFIGKTEDKIEKSLVEISFCPDKPSHNDTNEFLKPDFTCLLSNPDITLKKLDISEENKFIKKENTTEYESNDFSNDFDDREELLAIPIEVKEETEVKPHRCACGVEFDCTKTLKEHLKVQKCIKFKKRAKRQTIRKTNIPIKNELACPKCDLTFDVVSLYDKHQLTHLETDTKPEEAPLFQCSLCFRSFKTKKTLTKHIKRHAVTDNVRHTCSKCKREFKYKAFLESHMLTVHVKVTDGLVCEICTEKCPTKKSLEMHMDGHKNKKNVCPFCDKSFMMVCTLKDHVRIHTGEKPFLCSICGRGFSQKTNLAQHVRRHMGVKPFNCDICKKGFVSKGELDAHNRKHSGLHPFICDDCGNGFTTSSALVKHRRIHTGERPYACDLCPMRFAATGTLKNHRRTHTGERPYQCSHCEKSFVQRSDLISHIRCHTGERPFVCPQCGQAFRKAAAMKAHVKMHTRENQNAVGLQGMMAMGMHCDNQISTA